MTTLGLKNLCKLCKGLGTGTSLILVYLGSLGSFGGLGYLGYFGYFGFLALFCLVLVFS